MTSSRESKIDAALSALIILGFLAIVGGNALCWVDMYGRNAILWRWVIVVGMGLGTIGSIALSARVFWRHRIHLAAWMLMFGIHATGMALATQLFNWMHPVHVAGKTQSGANALLLAISLVATLLVRGAVLQAVAKTMPGWMAIRKENESATPRLWLFALYWLSPLAWWGGILCAITLWTAHFTSSLPVVALIGCIAIATIRVAVRFVLYEKNKYSNWARSLYGWEKFRGRMINIGFVLAGIVTFYAYFFMASRVQDEALYQWTLKKIDARRDEIKGLQPPALLPKDNAETLYKMARSFDSRNVDTSWMESNTNWTAPASKLEIKSNLTSLSYFRQASLLKSIDYGIDFTALTTSFFFTARDRVSDLALIEARQSAIEKDWKLANENFNSCLRYSRHYVVWPSPQTSARGFSFEYTIALTIAATLFESKESPDAQQLVDLQRMIDEHLSVRGETASRAIYIPFLACYRFLDIERDRIDDFPGTPDVLAMARESALSAWERQIESDSLLGTVKVAMSQQLDREDAARIVERMNTCPIPYLPPEIGVSMIANLDALESLRLLETAIAVKRYQLKHGTWPGTLNDCIPEFLTAIPPDPNKRGRFIQYESSPPRVYSIGKGVASAPEEHGLPDEKYFDAFELKIKECANGNHVLFLAN